jgi:hypothetical protein
MSSSQNKKAATSKKGNAAPRSEESGGSTKKVKRARVESSDESDVELASTSKVSTRERLVDRSADVQNLKKRERGEGSGTKSGSSKAKPAEVDIPRGVDEKQKKKKIDDPVSPVPPVKKHTLMTSQRRLPRAHLERRSLSS